MPFNLSSNKSNNIYNIENSCRFNYNDSPYLTRTLSASNRDIWTFSIWVKRGNLSGINTALFYGGTDGNNFSGIRFNLSDSSLVYEHYDGGVITDQLITEAVFLDPSEWIHIVCSVDTTQPIESNRVKFEVNRNLITSFNTANYPDQFVDTDINAALEHRIGGLIGGGYHFDGYFAEVHFIDGLALDASYFGEVRAGSNQWSPKRYTGDYGTNGFYLDFADASHFGNDVSSNGNDFTDSGLSTTDQTIDTPTNNFCTLNSIDTVGPTSSWVPATYSDGNLTWTNGGGSNAYNVRGTFNPTSGKWYFEYIIDNTNGSYIHDIGISSVVYRNTTGNFGSTNISTTFTAGDVVMIAFDIDAGLAWIGKNGTWDATIGTPGSGGEVFSPNDCRPFAQKGSIGSATIGGTFNFGQLNFVYTPPSGFKSLCASNIEAPSIKIPSKYFDIGLHSGTGAIQSVTGLEIQGADLAIVKSTDTINSWGWFDTDRGLGNSIKSDSQNAEEAYSDGFTSLDVGGYTMGADVGGLVNTSGRNYITYLLKSGILPGFDIVTYTGDGNATQAIAHSLGVTPDLVIVMSRDVTSGGHRVYHPALDSGKSLYLNSTSGQAVENDRVSAVSSSTFTVAGTGSGKVNGSGEDYVAYLFASVPGFSAFGSHIGNASTDGPFLHLNFKPKLFLAKRFDNTGNWLLYDSARNPFNRVNAELYPNSTSSESTGGQSVDFLSNGLKIRSSGTTLNANGGTYIYAAFAEVPFQFSRAA